MVSALLLLFVVCAATPQVDAQNETIICDDIDIIFAVDSSGSLSNAQFTTTLEFVVDVLGHLDIAQNKVRVALVKFSNVAEVEFNLTKHDTRQSAVDDIMDTVHVVLGTNTHLAIHEIRNECNGRQTGTTKQCVGVIVTDGLSGSPSQTVTQATAADSEGIKLIAVGVGITDLQELRDIASGANDTNVFSVGDVNQLAGIALQVTNDACLRETTTPAPHIPCSQSR